MEMERFTKQIIKHIIDRKNKLKEIICLRSRQEVNINGYGSYRYTIKHGPNKGKVLWSNIL